MADFSVEERAHLSEGGSSGAIHDAVLALLQDHCIRGGTIVDVGCGRGALRARLSTAFAEYIGADAVRHHGFPDDVRFVQTNLDSASVSMPDSSCDVVACVETIEHVENPRALMRELIRLAKPGGWVLVTTPNQLSVLSKFGLVAKNEFVHFQERPGLYPAHISALLEVDLVRMCRENRLEMIQVRYSGQGRIPLTGRDWPSPLRAVRGARGRAFSDNILILARKPQSPPARSG